MSAEYTASLCESVDGKYSPYKQVDLAALNDPEAAREADRWAAEVDPIEIRDGSWLIVKNGTRSFRPKKL